MKINIDRISCNVPWNKVQNSQHKVHSLIYKNHVLKYEKDYTYVGKCTVNLDNFSNIQKKTVNFWREGRPEKEIFSENIYDLHWYDINDVRVKNIASMLELQDYKISIQTLNPGKCIGAHYDEVSSYHLDLKEKDSKYDEKTPDELMNIYIIFLTDWEHGQAFMIGRDCYNQWKKGDIISFPWYMKHSTVNASTTDRTIMYVVGTRYLESR
jgi:hypothetical protein